MRPRKVILCAFENEQDLSVLKVVLRTNGFAILDHSKPKPAIAEFTRRDVDLVLTDFDTIVGRMKQVRAWVPVMIIGDRENLSGQIHCADALLDKKTLQTWELLERVKIMIARKRGPRPASSPTSKAATSVA